MSYPCIASDMKYQHIIPLQTIIDHIIISLYQHIIPLQKIISSLYLPIPSILISQYATDLTPISRFIQDRLGRDDLAIPDMIHVTIIMMMMIVKVIMMTCTKVIMMMSILGGRVFGYF